MANQEHLDLLKRGSKVWNEWRAINPKVRPNFSCTTIKDIDLSKANLSGANFGKTILADVNFEEADLSFSNMGGVRILGFSNLVWTKLFHSYLRKADLHGVNLTESKIWECDLTNANLTRANLSRSDLSGSNLMGADLSDAQLCEANLGYACMYGADLAGADLRKTILVGTDLRKANLSCCWIFGLSAWDLKTSGSLQFDLVVTNRDDDRGIITTDSLEIAQFIYLLSRNERIRDVIDTIGKKAILILGRFTRERKTVLDAIRCELRTKGYIPILFDFEKPSMRNITETVSVLAHLSRFIIADLTQAKSIPQELQRIVPNLPSVPILPILHASDHEYSMFKDFLDYPWVLTPHVYEDQDNLLESLAEKIIAPAEKKAYEIEKRRMS